MGQGKLHSQPARSRQSPWPTGVQRFPQSATAQQFLAQARAWQYNAMQPTRAQQFMKPVAAAGSDDDSTDPVRGRQYYEGMLKTPITSADTEKDMLTPTIKLLRPPQPS